MSNTNTVYAMTFEMSIWHQKKRGENKLLAAASTQRHSKVIIKLYVQNCDKSSIMSGHPSGFPSPGHQGNFPQQMQMRNQMTGGGPMVPMMNMANMGMQNQMVMMNSPMGYNQSSMMMQQQQQQPPQQSPQQTLPSPGPGIHAS